LREELTATRLGRPAPSGRHAGGIRPKLFYGIFAALVATNVASLAALLISPDISALINGQTAATLSAYQDRIAQLRVDIDRLHSRQYAQTGDINLELQDLAQQQEVLAEQHQYVKALAQKAEELGIGPIGDATDKTEPPLVPLAPLPKRVSLEDPAGGAAAIEQAGHQLRQMMDDSRNALAAISAQANSATDEILASLKSVGIEPDMPANDAPDGVGGPLLPPQPDAADSESLVDQANDVATALARYKDARLAIEDAPIHMPIPADTRISSPFGNRVDPFTGRVAFHPGIDFPWPTGTLVRSAGAGKVSFVGQINGYGNAVDIDCGGGIVDRYGHLSAFLVKKGDTVDTGTPIGRVGSTGRSTGPHLHFEVRRDNVAINPAPFLELGRRLARFVRPDTREADKTIAPNTGAGGDQDGSGATS
jgi:murein DD-endopeptidase MepM/ murein hydrolase activator NlpD